MPGTLIDKRDIIVGDKSYSIEVRQTPAGDAWLEILRDGRIVNILERSVNLDVRLNFYDLAGFDPVKTLMCVAEDDIRVGLVLPYDSQPSRKIRSFKSRILAFTEAMAAPS